MARTAVSGRLTTRGAWRPAVLVDRKAETDTAHTLVFDAEGWTDHLPGQHVDVRLTAEDGYQAARSYSLAAPPLGSRIAVTVQRTAGGEVSPFLTDVIALGDAVEVRGPLGGWFVWRPTDIGPLLLIGGGSGVVPLMAMIRARPRDSAAHVRLMCSVRTPADRLYSGELERRAADDSGLDVTWLYTRRSAEGDSRLPGRLGADDLGRYGWPPEKEPTTYVCGPTGFVESVATALLESGHDPARIRTERFGGS